MDTPVLTDEPKITFISFMQALDAFKKTRQDRWPRRMDAERERERERESIQASMMMLMMCMQIRFICVQFFLLLTYILLCSG